MPRDIPEAVFDTAMKGQDAEREERARLLHDRHPRTCIPRSRVERAEEPYSAPRV